VTGAEGAALVAELERRYVCVTDEVALGEWKVALLRPRQADELISEADFARDERLPYWADIWPSARVLAADVQHHAGAGLPLLELGCGLGLVSLAALRAGYDVLATDYYEDALLFARANAWRVLGRAPETRMVDWRAVPSDLGIFHRVLAADVLYEPRYAAIVAGAVARTLAPMGEAIIADPGRAAAGQFVRECADRGLRLVSAEAQEYQDGSITQRITFYVLRRATG